MRAQHSFGLSLGWLRVTTVFLLDIGILSLARRWPTSLAAPSTAWWAGAAVAGMVTTAALITHRRVALTAIVAAWLADRFAVPATLLTEGRATGFDHRRRYGRAVVGMRGHRGRVVSVIAVAPPPAESAGRHRRGPESAPTLPVHLIAAGLRQFDVRLDGIDIVSVATEGTAGEQPDTAQGTAALPPERRENWVVLRMDPMRNADAIAARDSVAATLAAATERLAHDLVERHIDARILTIDEFDRVDAAVLAGLQPGRLRRSQRRLKQREHNGPKQFAATFWMSPRDINSANLERLWLPATATTVLTVRLTASHGRPEVAVLVRYHSDRRLRRKVYAGLNRLTGRQLTALRTSLPTPMSRTLAVPGIRLNDHDLQVPLGSEAPRTPVRVKIPA